MHSMHKKSREVMVSVALIERRRAAGGQGRWGGGCCTSLRAIRRTWAFTLNDMESLWKVLNKWVT